MSVCEAALCMLCFSLNTIVFPGYNLVHSAYLCSPSSTTLCYSGHELSPSASNVPFRHEAKNMLPVNCSYMQFQSPAQCPAILRM